MGKKKREPEYMASTTPARLACPQCGRDLVRVERHLMDRLISLLAPRQRYRCRMHDCNWEGCLRITGEPRSRS